MGGRAWSQEELIRLEELTETYPLATVARKLNRSESSIKYKLYGREKSDGRS